MLFKVTVCVLQHITANRVQNAMELICHFPYALVENSAVTPSFTSETLHLSQKYKKQL